MTDTRYGQPPIVALGDRPVQDVSGVLGSRIFAWVGDIIILAILGSLVWFALAVLGIVTFGHELHNQRGELVLKARNAVMVRRRESAEVPA